MSICIWHTYDFDFGLNFTEFPSGEHLDMGADLFTGSRLARAQFNVTRD